MNDQSQIEAKIVHLTPPQRFQAAHQLPKDRPAAQGPGCPTPQSEECKVVTTNHSKIRANRILNGTWLLITLLLKKCSKIDRNLLVVYVALVLLLLQVFMAISRAKAGPVQRPLLMTIPCDPGADWQHIRSSEKLDHHHRRIAPLAVQVFERNSFTLPKTPPWQFRLAPTCHRKRSGYPSLSGSGVPQITSTGF